jgi:hypothetical protein
MPSQPLLRPRRDTDGTASACSLNEAPRAASPSRPRGCCSGLGRVFACIRRVRGPLLRAMRSGLTASCYNSFAALFLVMGVRLIVGRPPTPGPDGRDPHTVDRLLRPDRAPAAYLTPAAWRRGRIAYRSQPGRAMSPPSRRDRMLVRLRLHLLRRTALSTRQATPTSPRLGILWTLAILDKSYDDSKVSE